MTDKNVPDRRRRPRTEITSPALIQIHGNNDQQLGIVTDVSTNGLAIQTVRPPAVGDTVTVRAYLGQDLHGVQAEVIHVKAIGKHAFVVGLKYDLLTLEEDPFLQDALRQNRAY